MANQIKSDQAVPLSNQNINELLDDCASPEAIDELLASKSQQAAWYRYHAVRSTLKNEHSAYSSLSFTQAIAAKIADEPAILASPRKAQSTGSATILQFWKRAGGSLAIAASVAYAMVFSVQMMNSNPHGLSGSGLDTATVQTMPVIPATAAETEEQARLDALQDLLDSMSKSRLNAYEQQVGGEWVISKEVKLDQLQELERQVDKMKMPSEVSSDSN